MKKKMGDTLVLVVGFVLIAIFWILMYQILPVGIFLVIIGAMLARAANSASNRMQFIIGTLGSWLYPIGVVTTFIQSGIGWGTLSLMIALVAYRLSDSHEYDAWNDFIKAADDSVKPLIREYVDKLFKPDKINPEKFKANYVMIVNTGLQFDFGIPQREPDFNITTSIKKLDFPLGIPLGFSKMFVSAYPDVILWNNSLSDKKLIELFGGREVIDLIDINKEIRPKYLRLLVDAYLKTGKKLECCSVSL